MKAYPFRNTLIVVFTFLLIFSPVPQLMASDTLLRDIRTAYQTAHNNADQFKTFQATVDQYTGTNPLLLAYKASATALKGKYAISPVSKVRYAKKALSQLDSLLDHHEKNTEIIFLRLAIEQNIPSFLNMSPHVEEDKESIMLHLPSYLRTERKMGEFIITSLIAFGLISEEEGVSLKKESSE